MAFPWDPRAVLNIYPNSQGFTCVGTTKKGSRCGQSMISGADLSQASQILNTITLFHPASRTVHDKLADLAYLTLCPRWHRKPDYCQVTEMVQKWQRTIEAHCDSIATTIPITISHRRPEVATRLGTSTAPKPSSHVRARRAPLPSTEPVVEESPIPSATRRPSILSSRQTVSSTPPASPGRSAASPVAAPSCPPTSGSSSELPTPPTTPTHRISASAVPVSPTNSNFPHPPLHDNATIPLASSTPVPSVPVQTPCSRPHRIKRKPITDDCCICYEPICCLDDAVWCRAQCGQNVHRECFRDWRVHSLDEAQKRRMDYREEDNLEVVNCVFCRARWRWEWED
jgi:hypothetical protein